MRRGATDEEEGDQQGEEIFLFDLVLMVASSLMSSF